jgi:hypothetical protein
MDREWLIYILFEDVSFPIPKNPLHWGLKFRI